MSTDDRVGELELIGTGIVISNNAVITCIHVVEKALEFDTIGDPQPSGLAVLSGKLICPATRVHVSQKWDLCCLYFDQLYGVVPTQLFRAESLRDTRLAALGFAPDMSGPRLHVIPALTAVHDEQYEGKLQATQLDGGVPGGFSGGPVLAQRVDHWRVVGMLQLGGEEAATSRMIAVDPIANFLASDGVALSILNLPTANPQRAPVLGQNITVGRNIDRSIVRMQSAQGPQDLDVGGSISDTEVVMKSTSSEKE